MSNWNRENDDVMTFRVPSKDQIRETKHKEYNKRQKSFVAIIGENMASFGCILIVLMFVGYIWTDMKVQIFSERMICDALASIVSFILIEDLMSRNGVKCGKRYDDYVNAVSDYDKLRANVISRGVSSMYEFCEVQINREYTNYLKKKCREYKIDYNEYVNKWSKLPAYELRFHVRSKVQLYRIKMLSKIEPIELTPDMLLMTDIGERRKRGGIGISAQEYLKKKTRGTFSVITTVLSCILSASIAFFANEGASWGLVMYTLLKLILLTWRMAKGYNEGVMAYNTYEVRCLNDKMLYLNLYIEFLNSEQTGEEYVEKTDEFEQTNTQGCREGEGGSVLHNGSAESFRAATPG